MAVVSNTSPVRHLVLLGQSELIGRLFGTVLILKVRAIEGPPNEELSRWLDSGEAEAIQLALQLEAEVIILDERNGREAASGKGLNVIGVLGIFREAYRQGWIDNPLELLQRLRTQGFRISRPLARRFEEQVRLARPY